MKNILNRHFWTKQNSKLLLFALAPIPIIAGAAILLIGKLQGKESDQADPGVAVADTKVDPVVERPTAPVTVIEVEPEVEPEEDSDDGTADVAEETMLNRFLGRLEQVAESSELSKVKQELQSGLADAETIELISTTVFENGHRSLNKQQSAELVASLDESAAIKKYSANQNATLVVLGYADQVGGESANNLFALYRARSVSQAVKDSSQLSGAELEIKSWFVGETDFLSKEQENEEIESNRAAEVWLIVHDGDLFGKVASDVQSQPEKCEVASGGNGGHRKQMGSNHNSRESHYGNSHGTNGRNGNSCQPPKNSRHRTGNHSSNSNRQKQRNRH